jgi:DNA-binding protein HU-beta
MNKAELVALIADKVDLTKKATEEVINLVFDTISETLETGEKVVISGFGTFEIRSRVARTGRNPRTGADIDIPAQKTR